MVSIIRDSRARKKRVSTRSIAAELKKARVPQGKKAPSRETVRRHKNAAGFKKHKIKKKPRLSAKLWQARLNMAKQRKCRSVQGYIKANECAVFADEKWFSEQKANNQEFDARDGSPVPPEHRFIFISKDHETKTQQVKIMYLLAVTSNRKIGCYELDFVSWNAAKQQKTKGGKDAKGITADFMRNILKQVAGGGRRAPIPGPPCQDQLLARQGSLLRCAREGWDAPCFFRLGGCRGRENAGHVASGCRHLPVHGAGGGGRWGGNKG